MGGVGPPDRGDVFAICLNYMFSSFRAANYKPAVVRLNKHIARPGSLDIV